MKTLKNCLFCMKTVFRYVPLHFAAAAVCFFVPAVFQGLQVLLLRQIVDSAVAGVQSGAIVGQASGAVKSISPDSVSALTVWGILLVLLLTMSATMNRFGSYQMNLATVKLMDRMSQDVALRLTQLEYASFEDRQTQELFQKMKGEPESDVFNCCLSTMYVIQRTITLAFSMGVIFALSPWIGLGVLLVGIPMLLMGYYAAGRHMTVKEESADARRRMGDLKSLLTDKHAMYEMKLFRSEELLRKKWEECSRKYADIATRENRKEMAVDMGSRLLNVVYLIFVVCMAAVGLLGGSLTLGAFTAALNGVAAIKTDLNDSGRHVVWMLENAMDIGYYMDFLKLETRADAGSVRTLPHFDIAFENVSFRYPGTERDVLKNVTFYVKEGERIAFVGENGAGKSTLIKLLCGLYEPATGNVTIGGVPVRDIASDVRPGLLSVVFQNFQSYQLSLRENVAFGNLKAISDDRRILEALRLADAEELADADGAGDNPVQPGNTGLDRSLGKLTEDGQDLSRGQWQRVAMARAFLSDARYVILDEPVASLDPLAESHMYENFARIFRQRGTILISHRLASAKMADRILVLDGGRIVQTGNHEELMGRQGLYRTMFLAQSSFYRDSEEAGRNKRGNEGSALSGFQPEI